MGAVFDKKKQRATHRAVHIYYNTLFTHEGKHFADCIYTDIYLFHRYHSHIPFFHFFFVFLFFGFSFLDTYLWDHHYQRHRLLVHMSFTACYFFPFFLSKGTPPRRSLLTLGQRPRKRCAERHYALHVKVILVTYVMYNEFITDRYEKKKKNCNNYCY